MSGGGTIRKEKGRLTFIARHDDLNLHPHARVNECAPRPLFFLYNDVRKESFDSHSPLDFDLAEGRI